VDRRARADLPVLVRGLKVEIEPAAHSVVEIAAQLPAVDVSAAVAEFVVDLVVRVAASRPDGQAAAAIVDTEGGAIDVLIAAEAEGVAAAFAPLAIAAAPDAEATAGIGRGVHLQRDLAGEQLTLVVERICVGAVRLRACLIEEGFGLSHRHVV